MNDKQSKEKFRFKNNDNLKKALHDTDNNKFFKKKYVLKKKPSIPADFKRFKSTKNLKKIKPVKAIDRKSKQLKPRKPFYKTRKVVKKTKPIINSFNDIEPDNSSSEEEESTSYLVKTLKKPAKKVGFLTKQGLEKRLAQKHGFKTEKGLKKYFRPAQKKNATFAGKQATSINAKTASQAKILLEKAIANSIAITKSIVTAVIAFVSTLSIPLIAIIGAIVVVIMIISLFIGVKNDQCSHPSYSDSTTTEDLKKVPKSVEDFVKSHKEAYILSWKAGGFLPSASIAQTMVENGFNFTNPSGTSLWQAHNMGGVKTSKKEDFPVTLASFGADSVDLTGTKAGTSVGDGTGGGYAWFKDYNAGIVGKAEFMAHQSLYKGAINNPDGKATLMAIANGGWATDPNYLVSLIGAYNSLGQKFKWIDKEAIEKYGEAPYKANSPIPKLPTDKIPNKNESKNTAGVDVDEDGCVVNPNPSGEVTGKNGAPTQTLPPEYIGKLTLPMPDDKNYAGNSYPFGQCTWGAYNRLAQIGMPIEWFSGDSGNGGNWGEIAKAKGYKVEKGKPHIGWGASFHGGLAGSDPTAGHIAVVEYINPDGSILVSETNVVKAGSGLRSWRVISKETVAQVNFIQGRK